MPKTLLLIEDSLTIQHVVQRTFPPEEFQVVVAKTAQEGVGILHAVLPDIVLADASLPGMDGFQICQAVRAMPGFARIPVVLLTSTFTTYDETQGQRVGVTDYLVKPFEPDALLVLVQHLLQASPGTAAMPSATLDAMDEPAVPSTATHVSHLLGEALFHTMQTALRQQLHATLEALTPQILAEVRQTVSTYVPEMLEVLLQQEIEKLKRAVAYDEEHGESGRGTG